MKAPFPYFGGKSQVASLIWERLGSPELYLEPFMGSGAVLLNRPHPPQRETVNDANGFIVNAYRAIAKADIEELADIANHPVFESDYHARKVWVFSKRSELSERLEGDPDYYDIQVAGWWLWCVSLSIGNDAWRPGPWKPVDGKLIKTEESGGATRSMPTITANRGVMRTGTQLKQEFAMLQRRLKDTQILCGNWDRVFSAISGEKKIGVLFDPPYRHDGKHYDTAYGEHDEGHLFDDVLAWCKENQDGYRIALCGYDYEDVELPGWEKVKWKAKGGYANQNKTGKENNATRETIWFSPTCLNQRLF